MRYDLLENHYNVYTSNLFRKIVESKDSWEKRGIRNKQIEHLDTIEKNGKLYQVFKVLRVNRLRTSILSDSISDIDKFNVIERLVDLNADRKRLWFEKLTNVNDGKIIDSMPISLNYIEKNSI